MSVSVPGFKASAIFEQIRSDIQSQSPADKLATLKRVNGVFELVVRNAEGKEQSWTLELKKTGSVAIGKPTEGTKPDITINLSDDTLIELAQGKLNGQKAFMSGKLKVKGNMMLATRLDAILKAPPKPAADAAAVPTPSSAAAVSSVKTAPSADLESARIFDQIKNRLSSASAAEKDAIINKVKAVFQFDVKDKTGTIHSQTLDLKNKGELVSGQGGVKPDITILVADKDFVDLALGKLNGQKAFMAGKIKIKGAIMLATKLDSVLKELGDPKAKL